MATAAVQTERNTGYSNYDPEHETFDFLLQDEGSIVILYAKTDMAKQWVAEHLPYDVQTWGQDGVVIEPRFASTILNGIQDSELTIYGF